MNKNISKCNWKKILTVLVVVPGLIGMQGGCSKNTTDPTPVVNSETSGEIIYSRFRDASARVVPILTEGSSLGASEVDSPNIAVDKGRVAGDLFMMFYESQDVSGVNTIALVTSNEEDFVILTVNRTEVIGLGAPGSGYETGATDPTVIVDKRLNEQTRRYKMWFEGRNGSSSSIIFATSADGLTWSGFTQTIGLTPSFGSVRVADPTVTFDGSAYSMWFEAINTSVGGKDGPGVIGFAESTDGVTWTIKDAAGNTGAAAGPVFGAGSAGQFDGYGVNAPAVLIDTSFAIGALGRYKLWYEAADKGVDIQNTIGYATSVDGLTWNRATMPILVPSSDSKIPLPFDSGDLEHPTAAIVYGIPAVLEGHFLMWYTGDGEAGASPNRIGLVKGRTP